MSRWKPSPPAKLQEHTPNYAPRSSVLSRIKTVFKEPQSPLYPPGPGSIFIHVSNRLKKSAVAAPDPDSISTHVAAAVADLGCGDLLFPLAEFLLDLLRVMHGHPTSLSHLALVLGWQADFISDASAY